MQLIKRDTISYKFKPSKEEIGKIQNRLKTVAPVEATLETLKETIERGSSFILAEFKEGTISTKVEDVLCTDMVALDIDNKDGNVIYPIDKQTLLEPFIKLIHEEYGAMPLLSYYSFSHNEECNKFRLIYKLDKDLNPEQYKKFYNSLILFLNKDKPVIDTTSNINRLWHGTNSKVTTYDPIPFNTGDIISRLPKVNNRKKRYFDIEPPYDFKDFIILNNYKEEICNIILEQIDIKDFILTHFGGEYRNNRGCCPIHRGDNKTAFVIYDNTCHCFTRCGTYNVISLAKEYYHINDFDEIALRLIREYDLSIPKGCLRKVR